MPTAEPLPAVAEATVRYRVDSSLVMDLVWAMCIHSMEPDPLHFPIRATRFATSPGIERRITDFWGDGDTCFTELFVIAHRGGVLFETDPDRVWAGVEAGAVAEPRFEALESETAEDQARYRWRITRLHDDEALRGRYLDLLHDVWSAIAGEWQEEGLRGVEAYGWELRGKLGPNGSYADLESLLQCDFAGVLPRLVRQYSGAGLEVLVTPAWFGRHSFIVSLEGLLLVGPAVPPRPAGPTAETRSRARRFKALGDATRLAILEATARRPRTVGELAQEMGVAQPTVSNHVRILREAGLLIQKKDGAKRLEPDVAALESLAGESLRAVAAADPQLLQK